MTTIQLFHRSAGLTLPKDVSLATTTRLIYALQPSASIAFSSHAPPKDNPTEHPPAHISGVNALAIDKFEGRYLLSGGADSSVAIWDLESPSSQHDEDGDGHRHSRYIPLSHVAKTSQQHKLGITQLSFYPFDSLAFLTSSYDHTVKLFDSTTLSASAVFDLDAVVYNIALSPIADHLLVACATQFPTVRLIDLRSGASSHSLAGHTGAVLSTAWSPTREHVLASGATDGSIRFWDIRRADASLGVLDLEDSVGVLGQAHASNSSFNRQRSNAKAHTGPVNGLTWTPNGHHIISCGHDARIRVWDTDTGANTLANFGPMVRNGGLAPCVPLLPHAGYLPVEGDVMFYPNGSEILGYELFEGKLIRRLKRPQTAAQAAARNAESGTSRNRSNAKAGMQRNPTDKITSLAWRAHDVEMYSAHADGTIFAWKPRTEEDAELDDDEEREREEKDEQGTKRKRNALEDIFQDLTKRRITFGGIS